MARITWREHDADRVSAVEVIVDGKPVDLKVIAARLKIKVNSVKARLKRRPSKEPLTWDELESNSHAYVYRKKLPAKYVCRNSIRKAMSDKGWSFERLAKKIGSTKEFTNRVLGHKPTDAALTPEFVRRVSVALGLDVAEMQELGAQEVGWRF